MRKIAAVSALVAGMTFAAVAEGAVINADFTADRTPVSKNLFGIFYEDINYAADGGLYGEMVQNRSFEFQKSGFRPDQYWDKVNINGEKSSSAVKGSKKNPLNENNVTYAQITVKAEGDGIANKGYNGMVLEAGKKYPGSVYLRSADGSVSSVTVTVGSSKKGSEVWSTKINITSEWKKYEFTATAKGDCTDGRIAIYADQVGVLDVDFVSLFRADIYKNEPNGFRKDLAERLEALHPAFIRFPGGCIVHGLDLENRYEWKDTVGPVEQRKEKKNFWGYQQSYGIGFYEYFRFCEDIGAEPLPVLSVGMAHNGQISSTAEYGVYAQDYLDMIEWATGPADSKWGKIRAEAGHPEPFKLNYIGIGNEDCGQDYFARFDYISSTIKAKYPHIRTIISSGFTWNDINFHNTWKHVREIEKNAANPKKNAKGTMPVADLVDEHYYNESNWFLGNNKRYDDLDFYPRDKNARVFIGEYASWVDGRRNNMYSAITEAAYMTAIERNGDIVEISSYAPLFAKQGATQWAPDMIWFDNKSSYATPDYYVQQMFSTHKSDATVKYEVTQPPVQVKKSGIGGTVGLGTWATTATFKNVKVTDNDTKAVVYTSADAKASFDDWRDETGNWMGKTTKKGMTITQMSSDANVRAILDNDADVANYTFEVQATKTGGAEGFLIMFGVKGKNLYWWNLGGWGNTQSCVEKGTSDARTIIGDTKQINLVDNKPYSIKIVVEGESYKCFLDGQLMHEFSDISNFDDIYAHVGEKGDKIIVKVVNAGELEQDVQINLNGADVDSNGVAYVLSGAKDDENSFRRPDEVAPKTEKVTNASSSFSYKVKPYSLNVIELQKK